MAGNTFGSLFCVSSFGESHGPAIGCVVDGCPPGMELCAADIQHELDRRKPGTSRHVTQRRESDTVEILSGVFEGQDHRHADRSADPQRGPAQQGLRRHRRKIPPRPCRLTYWQKYGIRDYRGGGRSSARETAVRVAAGAIARKWLQASALASRLQGWMSQLGRSDIPFSDDAMRSDGNPFFAPDAAIVPELEAYMDALRKSGDSVGAEVTRGGRGMPVGWGDPVYDRSTPTSPTP
jgi:chorismate synthase